MRKPLVIVSICVLSAVPPFSLATPIEVDLTTFTQTSNGHGSVSVDAYGSSADFYAYAEGEDALYWSWFTGDAALYNDALSIPANALTIQFDYYVSSWENAGDANFTAYLYNSGGSISPFVLDITDPGSFSGTETWTISGQGFVGGTVGLRFYVEALLVPEPPPDFKQAEISAHISKVMITTAEPIPEASTLMLFGSGLSGLAFYVRKRKLLKS